ncbi:MAG TPA: nucleotidyltransferase [Chryseosolibacter sp.]|nr:nucleotidyltransferase [Chryseosolibacter sp.]
MIALHESRTQLENQLDQIAESLQLDATRYKKMNEHYEAIKKWIESDEKFFRPFAYDIYPHGSVRIQTTVRPYGKNEFDLDIAVHLKSTTAVHSPQRIYAELKRRLSEHETYKAMLEPKNRCIRLNYAGDFHMDILPGVQQFVWDADTIQVPDRELATWVSSNPRGYATWFLSKANLVHESLLERALKAEHLPVDDYENKKPLQRAVQLIKRYRDVYFRKNDEYKTSSIVLTTIAGEFYQGQDSIFETVEAISSRLEREVNFSRGRIKVLNPVNSQEDFTDKWESEPQYYDAFKGFCLHLASQWRQLKKAEGIITEGAVFNDLFGSDVVASAQRAIASRIENARASKTLLVDRPTGNLRTSATAASGLIKPNTFYGR